MANITINKNDNVKLISITPGCETLFTVPFENLFKEFSTKVTEYFIDENKYRGWNIPEKDFTLAIVKLITDTANVLINGCPEKIEIFHSEYNPKGEGFFYTRDYGMLPYGFVR